MTALKYILAAFFVAVPLLCIVYILGIVGSISAGAPISEALDIILPAALLTAYGVILRKVAGE